jgi:uncharacterized protein (TIGR03083 family)
VETRTSPGGGTTIGSIGVVKVPQGQQIHVDVDPAATLAAYAEHRRRFAAEVASLDEAALAAQSRCALWSVADVLRHCHDVDAWMQALWSGGRPPFSSFNPITTPHEYVLAGRAVPDLQARDRYVSSCEVMAADVGESTPERWGVTSVSPVGSVPWWLSALHVFFDSWIHERDVLLSLGLSVPVEEAEVLPVLAYAFAIVGTLIQEPTDAVIAGVRVVTGEPPVKATPVAARADSDAASIIDALLGRGSIEDALAGTGTDAVTVGRFGILAEIFNQ